MLKTEIAGKRGQLARREVAARRNPWWRRRRLAEIDQQRIAIDQIEGEIEQLDLALAELARRERELDAQADNDRLGRSFGWTATVFGIGSLILWPAWTVLILSDGLGSSGPRGRVDYYTAVATLLPVLLVAAIVQFATSVSANRRGAGWFQIAELTPIACGEVAALYVLAGGRGSAGTIALSASASVVAFVWLVTSVLILRR